MGRVTQRRKVHKYVLDGSPQALEFPVRHREDVLAVEEPLEIRLGQLSFSVTMRTPGDDFDLVAGFLVSEGIVWSKDHIVSLRFCAGENEDGVQTFNVVEVQLRPGVEVPSIGRHVYTSSSCGICGTDSIESVRKSSHYSPGDDPLTIDATVLASLPKLLRKSQSLFDDTGGVHAAGLFRIADDGAPQLLCLREDVGRHNAVDKVVGWALREGLLPLRGTVLQVSGRASFELVQKAAMAGIPILSAVSAPSSLAAELAEASRMTLAGFSRGTSLNIYTGDERIIRPRTQTPIGLPV